MINKKRNHTNFTSDIHNKRRNLIFALLASAVLMTIAGVYCRGSFSISAFADSSEARQEIQESKDKITENEKKIEELSSLKSDIDAKLEELNQLKSDASEYITQLDAELSALTEQISELESEIEQVREEIAITEEELEEARETEAEQYASMKLRIKYIYEHSNQTMLDSLFKSNSFSDLLNKAEYITNVSEYDRKKLQEYVDTRNQIEAKEAELVSEQEVLEETNAALSAQQEDMEKLLSDKETELANYNAKISEAETEAAEMSADIASIKKAIEAEENNIASIEARIKAEEEEARRKAEESGGTYTVKSIGDIYFKWPCPSSSTITSYFGDRESPTEGASTNHKGIDISASTGASVVAAASGTVVISTYSASAGNYIMINHGGGIYTVYMHMSSLAVSSGAEVEMGQTIGAVGSTGYSTGSHLHFGIRVSGTYVNPLSYVSP